MKYLLAILLCLILTNVAHAAPKLCLVWEQSVSSTDKTLAAEGTTRSRIFDTVADAVAFLNRKKIPAASVTGLWELRPAAKQTISATIVEKVEPEIIREKRWQEVQWSQP